MSLIEWDSFHEKLTSSNSKESAMQTFDGMLHKLGVSKILYVNTEAETDNDGNKVGFLDNFPKDWMSRYIEKDYFKHDPIVKECLVSPDFVLWRKHECINNDYVGLVRKIKNERLDYGLGSGASFPLHHFTNSKTAILSLATDKDCADFENFLSTHKDSFQLAGIFLHAAIQIFSRKESSSENYQDLSNRQREVLYWVFAHKRTKQIADILNLSERTVNLHIGIATKKLKAKSRYEAAAKAVKLGLIQP